MLEDFLSYIESNLSVDSNDKILLSVSGGIDSMVMLRLFEQSAFKFAVAHIDHSSRDGASANDRIFVENYCMQKGIECFTKVLNYQELNKGNFQENARNARFQFLREIKLKTNCRWIATAHHKDDRWETFLMNLNRKSGITGLTSLRPQENLTIHPLLAFTRHQIEEYAQQVEVPFVHDSSNNEEVYLRNSIRLKVNPVIRSIFPNFIDHANKSFRHLSQSKELLDELIINQNLFEFDINRKIVVIDLETINKYKQKETLLYHIISTFDFSYDDAFSMIHKANTGAKYYSKSNEALVDRNTILIRQQREHKEIEIQIEGLGKNDLSDGRKLLVTESTVNESDLRFCLDAQKIQWPLTMRSIRPGDRFQPLGMKGSSKTIKKLCTDLKIDRFAKEDLLLVCKGEKILLVVGIKASYDFVAKDIKNAISFNISH